MTVEELREALKDGTLPDVGERQWTAYNCSRCGRPYNEHAHSLEQASDREHALDYTTRTGLIAHAFRTQREVGKLVKPSGDGFVYVDGAWDAKRSAATPWMP